VVEAKSHNLHDDFLGTNGALFSNEQSWKNTTQPSWMHIPPKLSQLKNMLRPETRQAGILRFPVSTYPKRMKGMDLKIFEDRQRFGTLKTEVESETNKAKFTKPSITRSPD